MLLGLFTGLLSHGGVDRVGRHIALVLQDYARERGLTCRFLSLNDPGGEQRVCLGGDSIPFTGFQRDKKKFALATSMAARHARLAYIAHPNLATLGIVARMVNPRLRYMVTAHGIDAWDRLPWARRWGLRLALIVTAPSRFTGKRLVTVQGVRPQRLRILPWALDPDLALLLSSPVKPPKLPPGKLLLTTSRLMTTDHYKGVNLVLAALPRILKRMPDVHYVVVGDGDDRQRLEGLARAGNYSNHVTFAGNCTDQDLAAYYQACDVFVMPSRKEGFGLAFLEAMACAKPVVAANAGAAPEVVLDWETGLLMRDESAESLAQSILTLLEDAGMHRRMGDAGRRRVEQQYAFRTFSANFRSALSQCTSEGVSNLQQAAGSLSAGAGK